MKVSELTDCVVLVTAGCGDNGGVHPQPHVQLEVKANGQTVKVYEVRPEHLASRTNQQADFDGVIHTLEYIRNQLFSAKRKFPVRVQTRNRTLLAAVQGKARIKNVELAHRLARIQELLIPEITLEGLAG